MKKIIYISTIFLIMSINVIAQEECPGTLVHYWKLNNNDGGFKDNVGGLTAQVETATLSVLGVVDSAQYFNGLSEISVPDNITFDWDKDDSFTVEFWLKKTSSCPGTSPVNNNVIIGRDDPGSSLHWWAGVDCQTPGRLNFTLISIAGDGITLKSKKMVIDGNWHHVAIVRDGEQQVTLMYVDAVLDTSAGFVYNDGFASVVPVNIGWLNLQSKFHLDASLDELAIHNVAVSESVITDHYNSRNGKVYCTGNATNVTENKPDDNFKVYPTVASSQLYVSFELQAAQTVEISIYDVAGKKLGVFLNERLNKGHHNMVFNTGSLYKNSVLLVQMKLSDKVLTEKIVIR